MTTCPTCGAIQPPWVQWFTDHRGQRLTVAEVEAALGCGDHTAKDRLTTAGWSVTVEATRGRNAQPAVWEYLREDHDEEWRSPFS